MHNDTFNLRCTSENVERKIKKKIPFCLTLIGVHCYGNGNINYWYITGVNFVFNKYLDPTCSSVNVKSALNCFHLKGYQYSELDGTDEQRDGDKYCIRGTSEGIFRGAHWGKIKHRIIMQSGLQAGSMPQKLSFIQRRCPSHSFSKSESSSCAAAPKVLL